MKFLILLVLVGCAVALPRSYYKRYAQSARLQSAYVRPRRAPVRTMLISGYYRPLYAQRRTGLEPETAMTAFATGDSVAAGSYLGSKGNCLSCGPEQDNAEFVPSPELDQSEYAPEGPAPIAPLSDDNEEYAPAPTKPLRTPKRNKKVAKRPEEEEDDVGEEEAPTNKRGYNNFFPIMFGRTAGRSGSSGGGYGGVTAIANSYSTGKGGVATSHATAYGGPAPRSKQRAEQPDDEE